MKLLAFGDQLLTTPNDPSLALSKVLPKGAIENILDSTRAGEPENAAHDTLDDSLKKRTVELGRTIQGKKAVNKRV